MPLRPEAQKNILAALQRFREIGDPAPSLYAIGCVVSLRCDHKRPSDADVLCALEPLLAAGVVVEDFKPFYLQRHFRAG